MKKIILFLTMMVTIIVTIPSIVVNTSSKISTVIRSENEIKTIHPPAKSLAVKAVPPSDSTSNNTNQGLAIEDQDQIYYSDGSALCSVHKEGSQERKLVNRAYPINIQVLGDQIYYINEKTSYIYKVGKDGRQNKKVSDDKAYSLNIYNHRLYFMDRYNDLAITSISLEGKDKKIIKDSMINEMVVYNDYVYYITRAGDLGKVRIDGLESAILKSGVMQFDLGTKGIYYSYDPRISGNPRGLYYLDFSSDSQVQLLDETPYSFNIHRNSIYYNHPTNLSLYSMGLDGSEKKQITGANTTQINIAGNYIFYKNLEDQKKVYRINLNGTNRRSLEGKTLVSNVTDLSKEKDDLEGKEISPKLDRSYRQAEKMIDEIIDPSMTEYEKTKAVHDYVINHASYDIEAAENFLQGKTSDSNAFTAYGVLINQKGVCQGYAEAVQILLSLAGIESDLVIGEASDGGDYISHMWNLVRVDGEYYMLDATWDDPVGPRDIILYDYFLIDQQTLRQTHRWAYDEYPHS